MASVTIWFVRCSPSDEGVVPLRDYLATPRPQLDYLKVCMDLAEVAKVIADHKINHGSISLDTVSIRGGSVVVCGLPLKSNGKNTTKDLRDLASVANAVAANIKSEYRPKAAGTRESFVKFGERALGLFKAY